MSSPRPLPDCLPARLYRFRTDAEGCPRGVMNLLGQLGLATADLVAAVLTGRPPTHVSDQDLLRMHRKLAELLAEGWVEERHERVGQRALRHGDRDLYRITEAGQKRWQRYQKEGVGRETVAPAILSTLAEHTRANGSGWLGEDRLWMEALPERSDRGRLRSRLTEFERQGWLERKAFQQGPVDGKRGHLRLYSLSEEGRAELTAWYTDPGRGAAQEPPELTRVPHPQQFKHHLLAVLGATAALHVKEGRFVSFRGDEDLRGHARRGRWIEEGDSLAPLPDGHLQFLTFEDGAAHPGTVDIEVLTSKYTDADIRAKYAHLDGSSTLFVADTERLCQRVEALVGREPVLLRPRS